MSHLLTITDEPRRHFGDEMVAFVLAREVANVEVVARFTIHGEPVSKSRARFTKRGSKLVAYTPEKTHAAEEAMALAFRRTAPMHQADTSSTFGIFAVFFHGTRQRRDVDNMIKLVCDGLNGVAWADDSQVCEVSGRRGHDLPSNARTEVLIYRVGRVERRTKPCQNCATEMDVYDSTSESRKFCSQACHLTWRREHRTRTCPECGVRFDAGKPGAGGLVFCSPECVDLDRTQNRNATVTCSECGSAFKVPKSWADRATQFCSAACRDEAAALAASTCKWGHLWSEFGHVRKSGAQYCRECNRIREAERKAKRR